MCWHLTIAVPPRAVPELPALFASAGDVVPEPDAAITQAVGVGRPCFAVGTVCACSLYRTGASDADGIRRKAARGKWSKSKLQRALVGVEDWSGLAPSVREAVADVAERWGRVSVFLFWNGRGGAVVVPPPQVVDPAIIRTDPMAITEGRLVTIDADSAVAPDRRKADGW